MHYSKTHNAVSLAFRSDGVVHMLTAATVGQRFLRIHQACIRSCTGGRPLWPLPAFVGMRHASRFRVPVASLEVEHGQPKLQAARQENYNIDNDTRAKNQLPGRALAGRTGLYRRHFVHHAVNVHRTHFVRTYGE